MGFVGSRGRRRSTLARGKGRNFREGAGAFGKTAVGDLGGGGGAGFTTGVGAGFTTFGANVGTRFTTGGGFLTGGGTGSTAKGPSRGGCAPSKSLRGVWPNSSICNEKAARLLGSTTLLKSIPS